MADFGLRIGPRVSEEVKHDHKVWTRPGYQPPLRPVKKPRHSSNRSVDKCSSAATEGDLSLLARMGLDRSSGTGNADFDSRHYPKQDGDTIEPITDTITPNRHHLVSPARSEILDTRASRSPLTGKILPSSGGHTLRDSRANSSWRHASNVDSPSKPAAIFSSVSNSTSSRVESPEWSRSSLKDRIAPLVRQNFKLRISQNHFVPNSNQDEQSLDDESLDAILTPELCNSIFDSLNATRSQLAEKRAAQLSQQDLHSAITKQDKDQCIEPPTDPPTTSLGSIPLHLANAQAQPPLPTPTLEQVPDIEVHSGHQQPIYASPAGNAPATLSDQHIVSVDLDAPLVDAQRKSISLPLSSAIFNRAHNLPTPPNTASPLSTAFYAHMQHSRNVSSQSSLNDGRPRTSPNATRYSRSPLVRPRRSASPLRFRRSRSPLRWDPSHSNSRRQPTSVHCQNISPSCSHDRGMSPVHSPRSLAKEPSEHRPPTSQERHVQEGRKNKEGERGTNPRGQSVVALNKNEERRQSNASADGNIVDGQAGLPHAPDKCASQSSARLMSSAPVASFTDRSVTLRETSPQNAELVSGAQSSPSAHVATEGKALIDADMNLLDIPADAETRTSPQVEGGKDHLWKTFNDIPGIWLFKQGSSEPDVLEETFEPKEIVQKWQSKLLQENSIPISTNFTKALFEHKSTPSPRLSWNLLCVTTDSVDILKETLNKVATAEELLQVLSSIQSQWPTNGQLIIEINPDHDTGRVLYGNDLNSVHSYMKVTDHIHNVASNMVRFIQLEDMSRYVFILFAKPILESVKTCDTLFLENLQMIFQKSRKDKRSTLITGSVIVKEL
ncbi:hypothetical protein Ac2012v2_002331 [Leucoagaricus gongylophorus]